MLIEHFENNQPDVRPYVMDKSEDGPGHVETVIGLFADGDPEGAPIFTLSEESAHELAIQLLSLANSVSPDKVHAGLRAVGIEL